MKPKLFLATILTIPSLLLTAPTLTEEATDRFYPGNNCQAMALSVITITPQMLAEAVPQYGTNFVLEEIEIENAVCSRLQATHNPVIKPYPVLSSMLVVFVNVIGEKFEIDIEYKKS